MVWLGVETARPIIEKLESLVTQGPPRAPCSPGSQPSSSRLCLHTRPRPSRRRRRLRGSPAIGARKRALLLVDSELIKADLRTG